MYAFLYARNSHLKSELLKSLSKETDKSLGPSFHKENEDACTYIHTHAQISGVQGPKINNHYLKNIIK